jgi:hypothetical protein
MMFSHDVILLPAMICIISLGLNHTENNKLMRC